MKTPMTSRLFEKKIDEKSGAPIYILKKRVADYQQGFYFVNNSMTSDGRYLWFMASTNPIYNGTYRNLAFIDFERDEVFACYDTIIASASPFVDPDNGTVYYTWGNCVYKREPDPEKKAKLICTVNVKGNISRLCTHLTRTSDKKHFFLDIRAGNHRFIQGLLDIETGEFEEWAQSWYNTNHGQINPKDDTLALCAYDSCLDLDTGEKIRIPKNAEGIYERLWLVTKDGKRTMLPPKNNYATHEWWSADGKKVYYCCDNYGIYRLDITNGEHICILECDPWHAFSTRDERYIVWDEKKLERYGGKWYRGCPSAVNLLDTKTGKQLVIVSENPENGHTPQNPNNYHIDPHPRFTENEKYIVFTTTVKGGVDLAVASVKELIGMM